MLLYRVSHIASEVFPMVALGGYILLFAVTFVLTFSVPPLAIVVFFLSLASLIFVVIIAKGLGQVEGGLARRILAAGQCPRCGKTMQSERDASRPWRCAFCETRFRTDGRVLSDRMILDPDEQ